MGAKQRCAACGEYIHDADEPYYEIKERSPNSAPRAWGRLHDRCFEVTFPSPESALQALRREAERLLNEDTS